jgi:competence protein ComEA
MWDWLERHKKPVIIVLIGLLLIGAGVFFYHQRFPSRAVEISLAPPQQITVCIDGEVEEPGCYTLDSGSQLIDAIEAAGGITPNADLSGLTLTQWLKNGDYIHIYQEGELVPQRVNINTAEVWLLQALPGIGEKRAQAIIASRGEDGLFIRTHQLVERGIIYESTFKDIKDLITV